MFENQMAEQLVFKQMDWLGEDGTEIHAYRSILDLDDYGALERSNRVISEQRVNQN